MALWLIVYRLVKRPTVSGAVAAVAAVLAMTAFLLTPTAYTSYATVVLTPSPTNNASTGGDPSQQPAINPLLNFNEGLNVAIAILVQSMQTGEAAARLGLAQDRRTTVQITDTGNTALLGSKGPFIFFTGRSTASPEAAQDIVVRAVQLSREELLDRQRSLNAPDSQLITPLFVIPPTSPSADSSNRFTMAAVGLILGLALGLGGAYLQDERSTRQRRATGLAFESREIQPAEIEEVTAAAAPEADGQDTKAGGADQSAVRTAAADRPPSTDVDKDEGSGQADETASTTGAPPTPDPIPAVGPSSLVHRPRPRPRPRMRTGAGKPVLDGPLSSARAVNGRSPATASATDLMPMRPPQADRPDATPSRLTRDEPPAVEDR